MNSETSDNSVRFSSNRDFADTVISLNKILDHPSFRSSPQLSAFLSYVVSEELAGRGALIKAYSVAVDALGRPESFDPTTDPVIRVMATRLRKALAGVYDEMPSSIPVEIMLFRGSYRPTFSRRTVSRPVEGKSAFEDPTPALRASEKSLHRYLVAVIVLSLLLAISMIYLVWDLVGHLSEPPDSIWPVSTESWAIPVAQTTRHPQTGCSGFLSAGAGAKCLYTVPDALRRASTGSMSAAE